MKSYITIKIITDNFDQGIWNDIANHPLQSWQWGEARQEMGIEILRIGEYSNNQITNVFQLTLHPIPYTLFKIGYLPRSRFPSKQVLEFLQDHGKKNNVIFIKLEPYELASFWEAKRLQNRSFEQRFRTPLRYSFEGQASRNDKQINLVKSNHPLFPAWTQIIDLTKSEDELLKNMHPKTRYNIRLAQKKGVSVKEMSDEKGFKIFSRLYFETCKRQKYFGHDLTYHKIVWENLKKEIAHIIIAFYENTPLAVYELFFHKETLYYPYGGTSLEYRNLMSSNLLMWEAIRFGKKLGAKKFDLWGSLPPNYQIDHEWAGFTRFKEGYGGKFVELAGSYDLVMNPFIYKLYNYLFSIRNFFLKMKQIIQIARLSLRDISKL